jgi:hypothetical protein
MCLSAARGFDDSAIQLWVESLFVFSVVWSVGATGDTEGREAFDTFFRYAVQSVWHPQQHTQQKLLMLELSPICVFRYLSCVLPSIYLAYSLLNIVLSASLFLDF